MKDKPWRSEKLRRWEEALPRLKEGDLEKPSQSFFGHDKRNERINCGILGEGGAEWHMAATSADSDFLPDPEECHE